MKMSSWRRRWHPNSGRPFPLHLKDARRFLKKHERASRVADEKLLLEMLEWYEPERTPDGAIDRDEDSFLGGLESYRDHVMDPDAVSSGYSWLWYQQDRIEELVRVGLVEGLDYRETSQSHTTYRLSHAGRTRLYELRASEGRDRTLRIAVVALVATLVVDLIALALLVAR